MITDFDEYRAELVSACMAERLELLSSTLNNCVLSILIAILLQHQTDLNKNRLPDLRGGSSWFWQYAWYWAFLLYFQAKSPLFVVLTGLEPVTSPM